MISKHVLLIKFWNDPEKFLCAQLNGFTYFYLVVVIGDCSRGWLEDPPFL